MRLTALSIIFFAIILLIWLKAFEMLVAISDGVMARKYYHNKLNETVRYFSWRRNLRMKLAKKKKPKLKMV